MQELFKYVGKVLSTDSFAECKEKIITGLKARTNSVVQRNLLLANFPQGTKSFDRWSKEISNAAKLIGYRDYDWKQAAVDAMLLQTSNPKLRERALQDNASYEELLTLGITKEQSAKGAALLEKASGQSAKRRRTRKMKYQNDHGLHRLLVGHVRGSVVQTNPSGESVVVARERHRTCHHRRPLPRASEGTTRRTARTRPTTTMTTTTTMMMVLLG